MTVAEAITKSGIAPSASYTGIETADDFVFAIQTESDKQTKENAWIVCADHVKEHSGALNASTNSDTFIRTGPTDTKSATQRTLSVNGNPASAMRSRISCSPTRSSTAPAAMSLYRTSISACAPARARRAPAP